MTTGADDYLGKPFAMKELIARLGSIIRRNETYKDTVLKYGNISLDCKTFALKSDNSSLQLSSKECELLALFMKQPEYPFSSQRINEIVWNGEQDENTVKLYISYLRNKLLQIQAEETICQNKKRTLLYRRNTRVITEKKYRNTKELQQKKKYRNARIVTEETKQL